MDPEEYEDVPEHQDARQLRAARDRRRDPRVIASIRPQAERNDETIAHKRSRLQSSPPKGHRGYASFGPLSTYERATAQSRSRNAEGAREVAQAVRLRR